MRSLKISAAVLSFSLCIVTQGCGRPDAAQTELTEEAIDVFEKDYQESLERMRGDNPGMKKLSPMDEPTGDPK